MSVTLAWINQSQGHLSDDDAASIVAALNAQAAHLQAAWPEAAISHELIAANPVTMPAGIVKAYWLPDADVAGALGYHDVDPHGDPYIRVFTDTVLEAGGSALIGALSISACSSHEASEEAVDPGCQAVATAADGSVWALETADPVENTAYPIRLPSGTEVWVSDFVTPNFFQAGKPGPYDHCGVLRKPFTLARGGYAVINDQQVFAEGYEPKQDKDFPASRTYRRLHR